MRTIYAWACDFSTNSGEGNLSHKYLRQIFSSNNDIIIYVKTPFQYFKVKKDKIILINQSGEDKKNSFYHQFIYPIQGLFYLIYLNFLNKKTLYLNYLPLWNSLLILFLPKNCIFGPITGSNFNGDVNSITNFCRKFFLPFFYSFSSRVIKFKNKTVVLSTDILNKFFLDLNYDNFIDNFTNINLIIKKNKKKKIIDFLIYYRVHPNKGNDFHEYIINKLKQKYKIYVFGDILRIDGVTNLGNLRNEKVQKYLSISKYTILSKENKASLFSLEARSNNLLIFFNKKLLKTKSLDNHYIPINYKKKNNTYLQIIKDIHQKKRLISSNNTNFNIIEERKKSEIYKLYFSYFC